MGRCNGRETRTGTRHPADQYLSGKGVDDGWLGVLDNSGNEKNNNCVFVVKRCFGAQKDQSPPLLLKHFGGERKKKDRQPKGIKDLSLEERTSFQHNNSSLSLSLRALLIQANKSQSAKMPPDRPARPALPRPYPKPVKR